MLIQSENTSTSFLTTCITPLCLRAAGLCSALALVASSFATEANESQTMQEVVVYSTLDLRTVDQLAASISVWTSDHAQARNAQHIDQLQGTSPNVNFSGGASRGRFVQIRGVGDIEQFVDPKAYPSVGLIVDGIELNGIFGAGLLFDVEQVEILRGPQGTRLGASALAGSINIISTQPTANTGGFIEVGVGKFASRQSGVAIAGKLSEQISARLAVNQYTSDGYIENQFLNKKDTGKFDEQLAKLNLRWALADDQQLDLTALHIDNNNGYDAFSLDNSRNTTVSDEPGLDTQELLGFALKHTLTLSPTSALHTKITSLHAKLKYAFDEDWVNNDFCGNDNTCSQSQFSSNDSYERDREEYSYDSHLTGEDFVVGVYLQHSNVKLNRAYTFNPFPAADFSSKYGIERQALYGQWTPTLTTRLSASLGVRYELFSDTYSDQNAIISATDDELWSVDAALNFSISPQFGLYALVARGNKAGGVNTDASSNIGFATQTAQNELIDRLRYANESLTNLEIGSQAQLFNNTLTSRLSLFYNHRSRPQFETFLLDFPPPEGFLFIGYQDNAQSAESHGVEWQINFEPNSHIALSANLAYIDSSFKHFGIYDFDVFTFVDIVQKEQPRAPTYQYHLQTTVNVSDTVSATLAIEGRDSYQFAYYFDAESGNINLAHASLSYQNEKVSLTFWLRNLLDESYPVQGLYFANDPRNSFFVNDLYTQSGEPRNGGVTFRYDF